MPKLSTIVYSKINDAVENNSTFKDLVIEMGRTATYDGNLTLIHKVNGRVTRYGVHQRLRDDVEKAQLALNELLSASDTERAGIAMDKITREVKTHRELITMEEDAKTGIAQLELFREEATRIPDSLSDLRADLIRQIEETISHNAPWNAIAEYQQRIDQLRATAPLTYFAGMLERAIRDLTNRLSDLQKAEERCLKVNEFLSDLEAYLATI